MGILLLQMMQKRSERLRWVSQKRNIIESYANWPINLPAPLAVDFSFPSRKHWAKKRPIFAKKRNALEEDLFNTFDVNGCRHSINGPGRVARSEHAGVESGKARSAESITTMAHSQVER